MLIFKWCAFSELTVEILYQVLQLRSEVFVLEQACIYQDVDGKDAAALHLLGFEGNELLAYCRLFPAVADQPLVFGRVVTATAARKKGYGKKLLTELFRYCAAHYPEQPITCSAQAHLVHFYEAFGLKARGSEYLEDGIPHVAMST